MFSKVAWLWHWLVILNSLIIISVLFLLHCIYNSTQTECSWYLGVLRNTLKTSRIKSSQKSQNSTGPKTAQSGLSHPGPALLYAMIPTTSARLPWGPARHWVPHSSGRQHNPLPCLGLQPGHGVHHTPSQTGGEKRYWRSVSGGGPVTITASGVPTPVQLPWKLPTYDVTTSKISMTRNSQAKCTQNSQYTQASQTFRLMGNIYNIIEIIPIQ